MGVKKFNRLESAQKIHVSRGGCVMHVHQFLVVINFYFLSTCGSWLISSMRSSKRMHIIAMGVLILAMKVLARISLQVAVLSLILDQLPEPEILPELTSSFKT